MNYTANYQLPQWVETDRILMDDFNDMTSAIDAALKTNADGLVAETAARTAKDTEHSGFGNCQLYSGSYVGVGGGSPVTHTFPGKPLVVMVGDGTYGSAIITWRNMPYAYPSDYDNARLEITWSDNQVSWFYNGNTERALNQPGRTYWVLALLEQDA